MTQILIKRSATSGSVPASLAQGEIAMNLADGLLFWADQSGAVRSTPLNNLVTQSQLTALVGGAPAALDTLKELADAIGDDANFASTVTTALGNRVRVDTGAQGLSDAQIANAIANLKYILRGDAAMSTWSAAQAAQARFNLGLPAPLKIGANTNLDPNLGIDREHDFTGAYTATAPAASAVFDGWRTGTFHNRGNGSITTANFVGTIAVPSGAYLDGVQNATKTLAYGQRGYLYYDAQATPSATWRWVWIERSPLLLAGNYTNVASTDIAVPVGYNNLQMLLGNATTSVTGGLLAKLSADGGNTFKSQSTDYCFALVTDYNSAVSQASGTAGALLVTGNNQNANGGSYGAPRYMTVESTFFLPYGTILSKYGQVNSVPNDEVGLIRSAQTNTNAVIVPNLIRLYASAGGTLSFNISVRGNPSS